MTQLRGRQWLMFGTLLCSTAMFAPRPAQADHPATPASSTPPGSAASTPPGSAPPAVRTGDTENVVVTGLSRRQRIQTAPVTASVFTTRNIQDARIQDVSDFIAQTPNVSIVEAQQAGTAFVTIDGLTQVRNGQSPVATIVDGVQQMDSRQFVQNLFDLDQIEVLQGPQGDLWGRNAIGGAIVINTRAPTDTFHAFADASIGNGGDYREKLGVSGPIIKGRLLYDLEYSQRNFEGLLQNDYIDKPADYFNEYALRGHLKGMITDNLTVDLRAGFDEVYGGADNYQLQSAKFDPNRPCFLDAANPFGAVPAYDANQVSRTFCAANQGRNDRDIRTASIRVTYEHPWATVTNTLAWLKLTEYLASQQEPYSASRNIDFQNGTQTQWNAETSWEDELRLTSPGHTRFRWMLGGYFLDQRDFLSSATGYDAARGIAPISTAPLFGYAANPTLTFLGNSDHNQDAAVFGHVAFDIIKPLTIEFGYRSDWNFENQYVSPYSTAGLPAGCSFTSGAACRRSALYQQGQPKVTLSYRVNRDITLYTDYGVGFRSGQFNQAGAAEEANLAGIGDVVRPERANTFEAGFKSQWLNGRLRVNGSVFDTQDENSLYFLFVGAVGAQVLANIDQVRLVGGALQVDYRLLPGLDVFANLGYTHSRISSYTYAPSDAGNWAPYVPQYSGDVGVQYRTALTQRLGIFGRFDTELHGRQYWDPENSTARNEFQLYNLKAGFESPKGKWTVTMFVNNLTDKKYNAEFVSGGYVQPAEPRMFGGEVRVNY